VMVALVACAALAVTNTTMPSYYAVGKTPRELGISIGEQQKDAFQELVKADDSLYTRLKPWMEANPSDYQKFIDANKAFYPDIYEEVCGIAQGAGLNESDVMLLMLRPEIESLTPDNVSRDNCFDIINNPGRRDKKGVAFIAHNEDWTPAYKPFGFVLHENMPFSNSATHITAFTYPASPVGFTFGYNDKGIVTSCNGISPKPCTIGGIGRYFINRDVLAATSLDDALDRLKKAAPQSAFGFGMSIGQVGSRKLYHAEMAPYDPKDRSSGKGHVDIIEIKPGQSYLHSNAYTHPYFKDMDQDVSSSTHARLERAGEMDAPTTPEKALAILGDTTNPKYPIYRHGDPNDKNELATISTALMDLDNALVSIYGGNPTLFDPVVVMPLYNPEDNKEGPWGTPFIVAVSCAGVLLVVVIVLIGIIAVNKKKAAGGSSVNSSYYQRVA